MYARKLHECLQLQNQERMQAHCESVWWKSKPETIPAECKNVSFIEREKEVNKMQENKQDSKKVS